VPHDSSSSEVSISLQGQLLLADPSLREGIFHRSVILLADHAAEKGALGLILNRPTDKSVGDFLHGEDFELLRQLVVYEGGPVAHDQLTFAAFWWSPKKGLRWALQISVAEALAQVRRPGRVVRAFIGCSGWTAGQLESELCRFTWVSARPGPDLLGRKHESRLWFDLMRSLSPLHRILAEAPPNPCLN
jgi:putative transcriptional regulator